MLLRLINGTGSRKVDSGLKMLIEPIQFWPVASQCYKKIQDEPDVDGEPDVVKGEGDDENQPDDSGQRLENHFPDLDRAVLLPVERQRRL